MTRARHNTTIGTGGPPVREGALTTSRANPSGRAGRASLPRHPRAFTLVEVLAALLFMAIVIPVAMQGVSVASRAGNLGQRKAAAIRVAERVLDEMLVTGEASSAASTGTLTEGDMSYTWTMTSTPWTEDAMTMVTVKVTFAVQGDNFEVSLSTLYDPAAGNGATASATATAP